MFRTRPFARSQAHLRFAGKSRMLRDDSSGPQARLRKAIHTIAAWMFLLPYPPTAPAILKMGRYMDTISPPTTTPRKTIIIGSIMAVRFSTA